MKKFGMLGIIGGAALLTVAPFSLQWSQYELALSINSANARIGRTDYGPVSSDLPSYASPHPASVITYHPLRA